NNQNSSLDKLINIGFSRILCSGNKNNAIQGIDNLISLNRYSSNRIVIMPGGGVDKKNCLEFKNAGFKEIHLSGIPKSESLYNLDSDYKTIKEIVSKTK
ncbi:MAG: copper homeostasis protein CutC, partial [Flavobacteriaceae bacterium]